MFNFQNILTFIKCNSFNIYVFKTDLNNVFK